MNKKILVFLLFWALGMVSYAQRISFTQIAPAQIARTMQRATAQATAQSTRLLLAKSVFRAYPQGQTNRPAVSGFIFKTTYQNQEEIFGVIAQHVMPLWIQYPNGQPCHRGGGRVTQSFTARVVQNDQVVDIPAEIVQMSAPSMPDVALVKFRSEDEKLLTPLTLAELEPTLGEPLQVIGFGKDQLTFMTNSPLLKNSLISLRFPMAGGPEELAGLCGSPALNIAGEVVGTVTGSMHRTTDPTYYTGYATRNLYLNSLVAAYHRNIKKSTFPLIVGGEKIVDLYPDEFVSFVQFRDENNRIIFGKYLHKFSDSIMKDLAEARYMELYIDRVSWSGHELVVDGSLLHSRRVVYDLNEKKILTDNI